MDNTITEHDLDSTTRQYLSDLRYEGSDEPDLAVDGLTESLLSRLVRLFTPGPS